MSSMPTVQVVLLSWNNAQHARDAVRSIAGQAVSPLISCSLIMGPSTTHPRLADPRHRDPTRAGHSGHRCRWTAAGVTGVVEKAADGHRRLLAQVALLGRGVRTTLLADDVLVGHRPLAEPLKGRPADAAKVLRKGVCGVWSGCGRRRRPH